MGVFIVLCQICFTPKQNLVQYALTVISDKKADRMILLLTKVKHIDAQLFHLLLTKPAVPCFFAKATFH